MAASGYRLTFSAGEIELPPGEHFIGRANECFIRIDQPMVSRRHARLVVGDDVYFEDLESRNGSLLNGRPVYGPRKLALGDIVTVGAEEFRLSQCEPTGRWQKVEIGLARSRWDDRDTSIDVHHRQLEDAGENEEAVEKALERLRADIAKGYHPTGPILEQALRTAAQMAERSKKPDWMRWIFEFCAQQAHVPSSEIIDAIGAVLRGTPLDVRAALDAYLVAIATHASLNGEMQFRVARIEQLRLLLR
jgi:hypothetical protein